MLCTNIKVKINGVMSAIKIKALKFAFVIETVSVTNSSISEIPHCDLALFSNQEMTLFWTFAFIWSRMHLLNEHSLNCIHTLGVSRATCALSLSKGTLVN